MTLLVYVVPIFLFLTIFNHYVDALDANSADGSPTNIIFIMLDDLGRSDIGAFGAEWDTPNIDKLISSSLTLSHHYIGYVCSASRSQFLTGRYSYHNGFGTLNVFDVEKMGAIPQGTPTIMEYLQQYSSYSTFGLGKWQLGSATYDNLGANRGFDHYWGFNGGREDYFTKEISSRGSSHIDFMEDLDVTRDWNDDYSTDQYMSKLVEIIENHSNNDENKPFFIYTGLQAIHEPFASDDDDDDDDSDLRYTEYYDECKLQYDTKFHDFNHRIGVCEAMLGVDNGIGKLFKLFEKTEKLKEIYSNTIIIFTSDNGGAIDAGSCNYPLRGGKNTFFEGNQRVLAVVGGGKLPDSQRGIVLDGLFSNVDWFPTILSFANIIPKDYKSITLSNEGATQLDGYNMYNYLMASDALPIRDHILFHVLPTLDEDTFDFVKDINQYTFDDMTEVAIIFYDNQGSLWKYLDVSESLNTIGNPTINSGWCSIDSTSENTYQPQISPSYVTYYALFNIDNDISETNNLFVDDIDIDNSDFTSIKTIINDKIDFYVNSDNSNLGNPNSEYLYGNFACFTDYTTAHAESADTEASLNDAWVPFMSNDEKSVAIESICGIDSDHAMYILHSTPFSLSKDLEINDNTAQIELLNSMLTNCETCGTVRQFEMNMDLDESMSKSSMSKEIAVNVMSSNSIINIYGNDSGIVVSIIVGIILLIVVGILIMRKVNQDGKMSYTQIAP